MVETTREMIIEVQQQLQKQGGAKTRKFFDDELLWALNKAQLKFRDSKIRRKADNSGAYEIDQLHTDALRVWTMEQQSLTVSGTVGSVVAGLPADYAYLLNDSSRVTDSCGNSFIVPNRLTNHAILKDLLDVPYYKTKPKRPISSLGSGGLRVYTAENFTVNGILIDYIRKPTEITLDLDCELPVEFRQAVCDLTVELILVDVLDQRAPLKIQQNQITG